MLIPRVIPCLTLIDGAMVKTTRFRKHVYLGDPVNIINLFNQFEVDEIALLDIRATAQGREPDIELITQLAEECWVPLAYGGGITTVAQIRKLLQSGVEKVIINSAATKTPELLRAAASEFGSQAVVGGVDVSKRLFGRYEAVSESGKRPTGNTPEKQAQVFAEFGAGEIFLNDVGRDGSMLGYDLDLVQRVAKAVQIPVVACGGAGDRQHLKEVIYDGGASAAAAGSIFVFSSKTRSVLVNFPERTELEQLLAKPDFY